jgi:flagellar hook-associated protein 2
MASNLRIGGLASGMEIDSIIKELMAAARKPVDKLYQNKTFLEWKKNDYRTINNQLRILRDEVSKMRLQSTYSSRKVIVGDTSVVTATSSNNAATTSYTIKVDQLAEVARNESIGEISEGEKIDPNQTIWSQRDRLKLEEKGIKWIEETVTSEIKVTTDGKEQKLAHDTIVFDPDNPEQNPIIKVRVTEGQEKEYTVVTDPDKTLEENEVYLNTETGELIFGEEIAKDSVIVAEYTYNTKKFKTTFKIHDESGAVIKEYIVDAGNLSLNSLFNRMSANRDLGIAIFYDSGTDKVSISTNKTGNYNPAGSEIIFDNDPFFTQVLKLDETKEKGGQNAEFEINGLATTRKNNEFTINGTTFTLQGTTDVETTVNVMHDGDTVFESIKSFIEKYNEIIDKINTKLTEQRYRDYPPLTNEQKKEMSEDEIKLWEEKAKSGTLRSDPLLRSVLDKMRFAWSSPVKAADSKLDQMTEYGIETGSYFEGGKLYIKDEARLKQAINENPDEVLKFFTNSSQNFEEQGVAQRLYNILSDSMASITTQAGSESSFSKYDQSILAERIRDIEKRIDAREVRLTQLEQRYWRQFTAMESAIQWANAQSAWLAQQFSY